MPKCSKTAERVADVWRIIGGDEGADRLINGELVICEAVRLWREIDGIIYFSVVTNGMTGSQWVGALKRKGIRIGDDVKAVLLSDDFKPMPRGKVIEVAVLRGGYFEDGKRTTAQICAQAEDLELSKLNAETACLARTAFPDKEIEAMGLMHLVTVHEPIADIDGNPSFLAVSRADGGNLLRAFLAKPERRWSRVSGFALAVL